MSLCHLVTLASLFVILAGCGATAPVLSATPTPELPLELRGALGAEYGDYTRLDTWGDMLSDLRSADVICLGEAHYEARDMATAFEIVRELAQTDEVVLAVERFSYDLQPDLDRLARLPDPSAREKAIDPLLSADAYQTVWGTGFFGQTGYPVNTPSRPIFEAMVKWAARRGIPLVALDVPLSERPQGADVTWRNQIWKAQIEKRIGEYIRRGQKLVVVGGINHMNNAPDAFPSRLRTDSALKIISVGQRDARYDYFRSSRVAALAAQYHLNDLIVFHPQRALVSAKGIPNLPQPPDYWIAMHTPMPSP